MKNAITFDDVLLEPQFSSITSRKFIDIGSNLGDNIRLKLPVISSPMDTITENDMAQAMSDAGAMGIVHRYNTPEKQTEILNKIEGVRAAAIGATGDYLGRAKMLVEHASCEVLCIDVAHGHHVLVRDALTELKSLFGDDVHIMAGNVATLEGFNALAHWGADSVRVGIGGGSICSTRLVTGHGVPTLQSVMDCANSDRNCVLIADGGIKNSGDIVKALAAGADLVILGSILAGTTQAPGRTILIEGKRFKEYRGMASIDAQIDWRGHTASVEGVSHTIPYRGGVNNTLTELNTGIRSGFSYSGALNLREFHRRAKFIKQTPAGQFESSTHVKARF